MDSSNENPFDTQSEPEVFVSEIKLEPTIEHSYAQPSDEMEYEFLESDNSSIGIEEVSNEVIEVEPSNEVIEVERESEYAPESSEESSDYDEKMVPPTKWTDVAKKEDPDYKPKRSEMNKHDTSDEESSPIVNNGRATLKNYTRTINRVGCIFKDCTLKNTTFIPDIVRIKLLKDYKLYVLKSSEVCSVHLRDQNWEELLLCTYSDFTATDIEDLLLLLKQASQGCLDFEKIERIPTRFLRYWMNVNKVQFQRIYDSFPELLSLQLPKTSLSVYLMSLQNTDVERIAMLLKFQQNVVLEMVNSVQSIVNCQSYEELNNVFGLEY